MEEWKDLINYEEFYQISNMGNIRSKERPVYNKDGSLNRNIKSRILKQRSDSHTKNYHTVTLNLKDKGKKTFYVHRLVALTFIKNPYNLDQVNHDDGDKSNNKVNNLEWSTQEDNMRHAIETGLLKPRTGFKNIHQKKDSNGSYMSKLVYQYNTDMQLMRIYDGPKEASMVTGFSKQSIADCARGRYKTCGGFIWKYGEE